MKLTCNQNECIYSNRMVRYFIISAVILKYIYVLPALALLAAM